MLFMISVRANFAGDSIVLDTYSGFSSVREWKNNLKTSSSAINACVMWNPFEKFVANWPTYSFKVSLFVLTVTNCHLLIDALQFTEEKYVYRFSEKVIFNQQTEIYRLTVHI